MHTHTQTHTHTHTHTQLSNHTWTPPHTHTNTHTYTHIHTHTHTQLQRQQWGPVCFCVSSYIPPPDLQFQRWVSGRCGKRRAAALCSAAADDASPPTGPVELSHCGKQGEWRIAVFMTVTMNETLRCLSAVRVEGGRLQPPLQQQQQQVIHLCPFPSHIHTHARALTR